MSVATSVLGVMKSSGMGRGRTNSSAAKRRKQNKEETKKNGSKIIINFRRRDINEFVTEETKVMRLTERKRKRKEKERVV